VGGAERLGDLAVVGGRKTHVGRRNEVKEWTMPVLATLCGKGMTKATYESLRLVPDVDMRETHNINAYANSFRFMM
jgi:hypothetical protein